MAKQRGGGGFAIGAGDHNKARRRACPQRDLNLADDLDPGLCGTGSGRVRRWQVMRDSGADHHCVHPVPWPGLPVSTLGTRWQLVRGDAVIMQPQMRADTGQRARCRHARDAETEDPDRLS